MRNSDDGNNNSKILNVLEIKDANTVSFFDCSCLDL